MPYPFQAEDLPYPYEALEPHIDRETMHYHHDKHYTGYTKNLNAALEKHAELQGRGVEELLQSLDKLPDDIRTAVRNNGGGYLNHTDFWKWMSPNGGGEPSGALADAIRKSFGSFDAFKEQFGKAAGGRFGSGWAWLVTDANGNLSITSTPNQDTPVMEGKTPILGLDVWEHAYYLKYKNARPDYVTAWWNVVNWDEVSRRFAEVTGK